MNSLRKISLLLVLLLSLGMSVRAIANVPDDSSLFIFTVDATFGDWTGAGSFQLPITNSNYQLYWEEVGNAGSNNSGGAVQIRAANHILSFGSSGIYRIGIDPINVSSGSSDFDTFRIAGAGDNEKLLDVEQWGTTTWARMDRAFQAASNLVGPSATDIPDFTNVTSLEYLFHGAVLAEPVTTGWNTSSVTNMNSVFANARAADPDVSGWDTSSVTNMNGMFSLSAASNLDVSSWDTSLVTDMSYMFRFTGSANPDVSNWDTSSVTNMRYMFAQARCQ